MTWRHMCRQLFPELCYKEQGRGQEADGGDEASGHVWTISKTLALAPPHLLLASPSDPEGLPPTEPHLGQVRMCTVDTRGTSLKLMQPLVMMPSLLIQNP